jgi:hypothetical protein
MERADGTCSANCHGQRFFEDVVEMVKHYLSTNPDPYVYDFLTCNSRKLTERYGGVAMVPRFAPSRRTRSGSLKCSIRKPRVGGHDDCRVEPLKLTRAGTTFTERDLTMREFLPHTSRLLVRERAFRAA